MIIEEVVRIREISKSMINLNLFILVCPEEREQNFKGKKNLLGSYLKKWLRKMRTKLAFVIILLIGELNLSFKSK